ncbi:integrin alpha-L [Notechis scutatus]|uniref:Integrin alpha-L n=1 Tax=Notechis scutatus TaxID=8663 RepID=A0A6J1VBL3_9SAUR|nr:integrin alpha-L [Notechis scutatus]
MTGLVLPRGLFTLLLGLCLRGPSQSLGYNIDPSPAILFSSNHSKHFGYQVLQFGKGSEARVIVGAPGEQNSTGKVYQCNLKSQDCEDIPLEENSPVPHLGMTLASNMQGNKMITCGPGIEQHCDKNLYVSGICYLFATKLHNPKNITTGYQKCLKGKVDLVFLFDGSASMKTSEFMTIKEFMIDVMKELWNSSVHFAAVQFSEDAKLEFDFNNYTSDPNPEKLLANVVHAEQITNTFKAIKFVANEVFIPERGTRKEANKVIVIITDGDASDRDRGHIEAVKKKNILRLIIGIGNHLNAPESQKNLKLIASEPKSQFFKILASFDQLKDSFNDLQSNIFAIEGTSDSRSFHLELSSSGFSADISQGRVILGAVGADNWAGGILEQQKDFAGERFITTPSVRKEMEGAYLGYTLSFLQHHQKVFYAVGAPRYQHIGRVLIFEVDAKTENWTLKQEIKGQQTGSYFGGVLCAVDIEGDQETDLLLIGAQQYFTETRGGRVYAYGWKGDNLILLGEFNGDLGYPLGRFGAAITDLADVNGDRQTDVAIGAPLEDEERGAVYIYNSHEKTLLMEYSQRITGASISPGLRYFGQSIHGKTDLSGDGLTSIAVGALGKVMVLQSRPIVNVATRVTFEPKEIPVKDVECTGPSKPWQNINLKFRICFDNTFATESYTGHLSVKLLFRLEIDPDRVKYRGEFRNGKNILNGAKEISLKPVCVLEEINITNCIEDYLSPIKVLVNLSLEEDSALKSGPPRPFLNPLSNRTMVEIPFDKNCGTDEVCVADLKITFHSSGSKELVVSPQHPLEMNLELVNQREDAYFTMLYVPLLPGLSFRKHSVLKFNAVVILQCDAMLRRQDFQGLACNVSHPIYRNSTKALIQLQFGVLRNVAWKETLEMMAYVTSENEENETLQNNRALHSIPVKYPINIIVKGLGTSIQYVDFSSKMQENKTVTHSYQVTNWALGPFPPPTILVYVKVPIKVPAGLIWKIDKVLTADPNVNCQPDDHNKTTRNYPMLIKHWEVDEYLIYKCDLGQINSSTINVTGMMSTQSKPEHSLQTQLRTALWVEFDTRRYKNIYSHEFAQVQVTEIEVIIMMNYLPIIIGSAIGGLCLLILCIIVLYKCGFFKRNYKQKIELEEHENAVQAADNLEDGAEKEGAKTEKENPSKLLTEPLNSENETQ